MAEASLSQTLRSFPVYRETAHSVGGPGHPPKSGRDDGEVGVELVQHGAVGAQCRGVAVEGDLALLRRVARRLGLEDDAEQGGLGPETVRWVSGMRRRGR